nr:hypothetical protein [Tanacetum cinerariifolium]
MSTQQDIYAARSENRPSMLNKENYVPWSSCLLRYAKSRPNEKLIHNSIINGPYVRRMIPEPGDPNRKVPVNETFHAQTDDELTEKKLKQIEADDQAIQTILLGLPEDIYSAVDSCETTQEIWLRVQQIMKGSDIGIQDCSTNRKGMNMGQDRQMQMVGGNGENQFRQYVGQNVRTLNRYNAVQNVRNQVAQNAIQNSRIQNVRNQNGQIVVPWTNQNLNGDGNLIAARAEANATGHNGNQIRCYNCRGVGHFARNCTVRPRRRDTAYLQTQLLIDQKEEAGIQLQVEEFDLMAAAADLDEIEEVNANCILMANLQQALTSGTQTDKAPIYDSDRSAEVHNYEDCYDNETFNMFTQEEQYTELLEPIPETHRVPQNDNNVISEVTSVKQSGGTVEQHPANVEETRVLYDSLYHNLAIEVEKVNMVNRKLRETNAEFTTELARYKNQEKCFEISQEKYDKFERCYQKSVYQEQCLHKKINALHLSSGKQITTLNEEISDLNKQLSMEKSTVTSLLEEKKKLKFDFKIREDELLDKQIQLEKKIKELDNILVKTGQSIQTIHMLSPKPDSFYHTEQKMALEETLQLAQESRLKMKQLNKEIKTTNYTKINHLSGIFVSQTAKSREELNFLNTSKTTNVSTSISIPNEEFSDDTTPNVVRKFLNEVKSTIVTLQRVFKHRITLDTHNWSSSAHQELHKIVKDELFPIVNQVDARVQNFKIQFLKEAAKFVGDFKSIAEEANEYLAKHKTLELEIERLLRAVVSKDIMSVVQKNSVGETSNLQTELERTKERFENCIIKKENEYAKLWNDCKDTSGVSDTLKPLSHKRENENVELEFQVLNYAKENAHFKTTYKNLFDSISVTRTQTKTIIDSLQNKLHDTIYDNAKLRAQLFDKVSDQKDTTCGTSANTKFAKQSILGKPPKVGETHALSKPVTSSSIPTPQGSKVVKNDKVIAPGIFRINPFKPSREEKYVPNKVRASVRTNPITFSQPRVITKKVVNSDSNGLSFAGVDITAKTRRPQPMSDTKNDRVPSASESSFSKNKEVDVEEPHRKLLFSRNKKHMSSECNNVKLDTQNVKSKVVCAMCKQCLISVNHDVCSLNYVNGMTSHGKNQKANVSINKNQKKQKSKVKKPKKVGSIERLASPKPSKPKSFLRWSPTGRLFDLKGKIIASSKLESQSDCSKGDNACISNPLEPTIKRFPNSTFSLAGYPNMFMFLGTVRFGNDHVAAILGFGDLQWGNILITRVYFVEGLGHNLFSVGQFCDSDLEVAFRKNACFVRNLEGVDLLSGNRSTNLYTINLHEMASASPICLMARASSTKSWLWHQRLSHLNFDTINDLAKNDLVIGLPKFKYHKDHLCPSCEQGKSKRASHPPKPIPNSRQRLHLLYMDLCGSMRIASINGKRYVLVIVDDYSRYTWVQFLRSKEEAPEVIKTFLKRIAILLQSLVIIIRTENDTEFKNQVLKEYFDSVGISHQVSSVRTPQQNGAEAIATACFTQYKLKKALYGLKQAPRAWYDELSMFLLQNHFFKGTIDPTLFIRRFDNDILVVNVYVDGIIFGSTHPRYTQLFSDLMKSRFKISMMREMTFFLGLQVNQSLCGIFINQSNYVLEILKKYGMESCDPIGTPMEIKDKLVDATKYRSMIGALMYLTSSRPDIVHATCLCTRYQAKPTAKHLKEVKRIFRYLRGTVNMGFWYTKDSGSELTGFSYADYAGCKDTFKSTSSGAQFLDEKLLTDYGFHYNKIPIYCDSKSAIAISCNPVQHSRTKHIAVRYHFIKEHVEKGTIELYFVKTDFQLADIFTKALLVDRFNYLVRRLGMRSLSPQELDRLAKSQ